LEDRVDKPLKIAYLGNGVLSVGFKIAGITDAYVVSDTEHSERKLKELLGMSDVGIIIMTSSVRRMIKDRRLADSVTTSIMPLVVELPELNENMEEEDTLRQLIMRAIGIDITKNV
jgi:vacuolar-type H+-ATPase subunit F/Vma7